MKNARDSQFELDTLYMAAVMKMHREKGVSRLGRDDAFEQTLTEMGIDQGAFEHFFESHREGLERTILCIGL